MVVLMSVEVGGAFGAASADAAAVSSGEIEVAISVEVAGSPSSVVAHVVDPGDDQESVSLGPVATGAFAGSAVVERADLVVVFEAIWPDGSSELSRPLMLTELGVDPELLLDQSPRNGREDDGVTLDLATERWGWAALALGAAALALLAWWALGDYPGRSRQPDPMDRPNDQV